MVSWSFWNSCISRCDSAVLPCFLYKPASPECACAASAVVFSRGFLACPVLDHSSAPTRGARRALFPAGARLYPDDKRPRHYPVAVSLPRETRFPLSAIALSLHKPDPAPDEDRGVPGEIAATFLASPRRSPSLVTCTRYTSGVKAAATDLQIGIEPASGQLNSLNSATNHCYILALGVFPDLLRQLFDLFGFFHHGHRKNDRGVGLFNFGL